MRKLRVYELAKELNVDSKKLVEKLQEAGINVKSYMSTLDEFEVSKAKELLTKSNAKSNVIVEEKRVSRRVIRRRRVRNIPVSKAEKSLAREHLKKEDVKSREQELKIKSEEKSEVVEEKETLDKVNIKDKEEIITKTDEKATL